MKSGNVLKMEMSNLRLRGLAFTSLAHFFNDGMVFFIPLVADILADLRGASPFELTLMFVVFYGSASILGLYVGRFADKTDLCGHRFPEESATTSKHDLVSYPRYSKVKASDC
jgi:predicted MFS family arabinose efflux permease